MQSIIALLAVLVGVAIANPMVISSDDLNQKNKDISATEYLKRIFQNSLMHFDSQDSRVDDLEAKLSALGLSEASDIARQVDLKQIIRDGSLTSFTLCLPSDEAVQKWRQELPNELKPEALKQLIKAWIVPGVIRSSTIINNEKVKSLNGAKLRFNVYYNIDKIIYTVNGAKIAKAREVAKNQIVQIIDKVIYPLPIGNVIQTLVDVESLSMIVDLVKRAELSNLLSESDPITVLVPTNEAFQALPSPLIKELMTNQTELQNLLKYHVISDVKYSASLSSGQRITALQGNNLSVNIENGKIILNQGQAISPANVIQADIPTTNGVIHVIDQVLFPF